MNGNAPPRDLLDAASEPYRKVSHFTYQFARGKLGGDPAYRALLERGLLARSSSILDLGCGQGLLLAWLRAALALVRTHHWPSGWPAAPSPAKVRGIELMPSDVERAQRALGSDCGVIQGDIRQAEFGSADTVVILDVLHYMGAQAQKDVLARVRTALPRGGSLLLRVGDAAAGLPFRYSQWVDQTVMLLRGHSWVRTHCRSVSEWRSLLQSTGFSSEALPMSQGTPFANVMLLSRAC